VPNIFSFDASSTRKYTKIPEIPKTSKNLEKSTLSIEIFNLESGLKSITFFSAIKTLCDCNVCRLDKPSAPENLRVTSVNKDSVTLAWDEPTDDGRSPIKKYVVEKADVKRGVFSDAGETTADTKQLKVAKLLEGNDYMFRVSAENEIGQGKPASLAEPVTAKLPFG